MVYRHFQPQSRYIRQEVKGKEDNGAYKKMEGKVANHWSIKGEAQRLMD